MSNKKNNKWNIWFKFVSSFVKRGDSKTVKSPWQNFNLNVWVAFTLYKSSAVEWSKLRRLRRKLPYLEKICFSQDPCLSVLSFSSRLVSHSVCHISSGATGHSSVCWVGSDRPLIPQRLKTQAQVQVTLALLSVVLVCQTISVMIAFGADFCQLSNKLRRTCLQPLQQCLHDKRNKPQQHNGLGSTLPESTSRSSFDPDLRVRNIFEKRRFQALFYRNI